ncbi:MAG: sulfatase [Deltaproteobacteria bacterium]|nr:sulfatase [Deltaproteobacteria bacterium]
MPSVKPSAKRQFLLILSLLLTLASCKSKAPNSEDSAQRPGQTSSLPKTAQASKDAPNIILVVLDTVRRDHLSTYGYERSTSPTLTRLAGRGVRFSRCTSVAPWTHPAHASMLTGTYPSTHGARYCGIPKNQQEAILALSSRIPLLQLILASAGYHTVASVGAPVLSPGLGVTRGFAHFFGSFPDAEPTASEVNSRLFKGLDRRSGQGPVFALVNYYDAHGPYTARPRYAPWIDTPKMVRQVDLASSIKGVPRFARLAAGLDTLSVDDRRAAVDNYDSEIARMDHALGELVTGLEKRGLLENSLVAITSDHGEYFGEHGLFDHGRTLFRQMLDVPLVVFGRAVQKGKTVDEPVQTLDLFTTFLEAAGLAVPPTNRGTSLGPLLTGKGNHVRHPIVAEAFADPAVTEMAPVYAADYKALQRGDKKLISRGTQDAELFDLATDPEENHDLSGAKKDLKNELESVLRAWLPSVSASESAPASLSPEEKNRLKALGYLK